MNHKFESQTLKDFENNGQDFLERAKEIDDYIIYRHDVRHLPYRVISLTGSGATMEIINPYTKATQNVISFVSNDYLALSHPPKVIKEGIDALLNTLNEAKSYGCHFQIVQLQAKKTLPSIEIQIILFSV